MSLCVKKTSVEDVAKDTSSILFLKGRLGLIRMITTALNNIIGRLLGIFRSKITITREKLENKPKVIKHVFSERIFNSCFEESFDLQFEIECRSMIVLLCPSLNKILLLDRSTKEAKHECIYEEGVQSIFVTTSRVVMLKKQRYASYTIKDEVLEIEHCDLLYDLSNIISYSEKYMSYASLRSPGKVRVFDMDEKREVTSFVSHKQEVCKIAIDSRCQFLATASRCGTIVRLFEIPDGVKLCGFRSCYFGGEITLLTFSSDSKFIAAVYKNKFINLFQVPQNSYKDSYVSTVIKYAVKMLPSFVFINSSAFAWIKLDENKFKTSISISITKAGDLYTLNIRSKDDNVDQIFEIPAGGGNLKKNV